MAAITDAWTRGLAAHDAISSTTFLVFWDIDKLSANQSPDPTIPRCDAAARP
jgi:hypothetical protein